MGGKGVFAPFLTGKGDCTKVHRLSSWAGLSRGKSEKELVLCVVSHTTHRDVVVGSEAATTKALQANMVENEGRNCNVRWSSKNSLEPDSRILS